MTIVSLLFLFFWQAIQFQSLGPLLLKNDNDNFLWLVTFKKKKLLTTLWPTWNSSEIANRFDSLWFDGGFQTEDPAECKYVLPETKSKTITCSWKHSQANHFIASMTVFQKQ